PAIDSCEQQRVIGEPANAACHSQFKLSLAMLSQCLDQNVRERDVTSTGFAFRRLEAEAELPGMLHASRILMILRSRSTLFQCSASASPSRRPPNSATIATVPWRQLCNAVRDGVTAGREGTARWRAERSS